MDINNKALPNPVSFPAYILSLSKIFQNRVLFLIGTYIQSEVCGIENPFQIEGLTPHNPIFVNQLFQRYKEN